MTYHDIITRFCPRARPIYLDGLKNIDTDLPRYEINTPLRALHFLAQIMAETGELTVLEEDLTYRTAARLTIVWPNRFTTDPHVAGRHRELAQNYINNPERLGNLVYANRMGNNAPGDGYRFRGRGLTQLTGRDNYAQVGRQLGLDLVGTPGLVIDSRHVLDVAGQDWMNLHLNSVADRDDVNAVTLRLNGGYTNVAERRQLTIRIREALGIK